MSSSKMLIRGKVFNPLSLTEWDYKPDGAIIVSETGRIEMVGRYEQLKNAPGIGQTLDFSDHLILPGLIDCHLHLPQLPIRGKTAGTLMEWLNQYAFPVEEAFADIGYAQALSDLFFQTLKANGTTTALVMSSVHTKSTQQAFESAARSGMRVIMGKTMMDQNTPETMLEKTKASLDESLKLAETWHQKNNDLLRYAFTPRFALSCSAKLMEGVAELAKRFPDSYIHSHLSENLQEVSQVKALYNNLWSYTEIYEKAGILGPRTIMAHGIHLSFDEITFLQEKGTRIAHCPTSNFFLKSGFFNMPVFQQRNVPFALGSDIGGGPDVSMLRVMRSMDDMQLRHQIFVKPAEALYYGTLAGAEILSLEAETGNLLPGKSADFVVINTRTLTEFDTSDASIEELLSLLIYLGDGRQILHTFVRGQEVYNAANPENLSRSVAVPSLRQLQMQ